MEQTIGKFPEKLPKTVFRLNSVHKEKPTLDEKKNETE